MFTQKLGMDVQSGPWCHFKNCKQPTRLQRVMVREATGSEEKPT